MASMPAAVIDVIPKLRVVLVGESVPTALADDARRWACGEIGVLVLPPNVRIGVVGPDGRLDTLGE